MEAGSYRGFELTLHDPGIALVTFNQPERLNGMTQGLKRDLVEIVLGKQGSRYLRIDGDVVHPQDRQQRIELFDRQAMLVLSSGPLPPWLSFSLLRARNADFNCFLLTTQVGGLGINLTGANRVVICTWGFSWPIFASRFAC